MIQLEMLEEVDRICKKCNIHYNIIAGTLFGSVRHGGYIPWDDDADVALLREEYEKFREACKTELDTSRFYFQDHRNTKGYRWGYGKLRRKNTLFLREHQEHMPYTFGTKPDDGVDWEDFCKALSEIGFDGTLSFETFPCVNSFPRKAREEVLRTIRAIGEDMVENIAQMSKISEA